MYGDLPWATDQLEGISQELKGLECRSNLHCGAVALTDNGKWNGETPVTLKQEGLVTHTHRKACSRGGRSIAALLAFGFEA